MSSDFFLGIILGIGIGFGAFVIIGAFIEDLRAQ